MTQNIVKSAVVYEDKESKTKINKECMLGLKTPDYYQGKLDAFNDILLFLYGFKK